MSRSKEQKGNGSVDLIPDPRDEEDVSEKMYGRNCVTGVIVDGWTGTMIRRLLGTKDRLGIKKILYENLPNAMENFEWCPEKKRFARKVTGDLCGELKDLCKCISRGSWKISEPIVVQVLEKKSIHVIRKGKELLFIGIAIVGDDSGYCNLTSVNGTIEYVYQRIKIGDHLILHDGTAQQPKFTTDDNISLKKDKVLQLEIKIHEYEARNLSVIVPPNPPKLPEGVFTKKTTWRPSELWNKADSVFEFPQNLNQNAINICGVISYVSQISRKRIIPTNSDSDLSPDPDIRKQFACFRWVQIVDSEVPTPLNLLIRLNNLNFENQCNVVTGTAVVVTNVVSMNENTDYFDFYFETSYFSRVFVNREIAENYLPPVPADNREVVRKIVSKTMRNAILKRKDVLWSAGGSLPIKISKPGVFLNCFTDEYSNNEQTTTHISESELARREVNRVYVKGYIRQIFKICRNEKNQLCKKLLWFSNSNSDGNVRNNEKLIETVLPVSEKHWFPFVRHLPILDEDITSPEGRVFETYEKIKIANKEICSPLLLPAKYSELSRTKLKDSPMVDDELCFIFYVFDPRRNTQYSCIWKQTPFEEMEKYVKEFIQKNTPDSPETQEKNKSLSNGEDSESELDTTGHTKKTGDMTETPTDSATSLPVPSKKCNAYFIIDLYQIEDPPQDNLVISVVDFVISD